MKRLILPAILLAAALPAVVQCGRNAEPSYSIESIQREEGVPVRVREIRTEPFQTGYVYNATLSGIEESSAYAMVADTVERVHLRVGDFVEKNEVVISFPTDTPGARYYQAEVNYQNAKQTYERIENLFQSGAVSRQERDNARAAYDVAEADWNTARQTVQVKAPLSGYITRIYVRESDNVDRGDPLFTISQTYRLKSTVWATDREVTDIRTGLPAEAVWNGVVIKGRVVQVDMAMNQDRQAFGVVVEFDNPDRRVRIGVTASVHIFTYTNEDAVVIERKELLEDEGGQYVYVVRDGKAARRPVETGGERELRVEILHGLEAGDRLIVEGNTLVEDGDKVKVIQ
jgi:membrane fusion protein (multidrug efflux system)